MSILKPTLMVFCGLLISNPLRSDAQLVRPDKRLQEKVTVQVDGKNVKDFLQELGAKYKLPVDIDPSVDEEGLGDAFSLNVDGVTLGSVIHIACEANGLVGTVEKGRLLVMTKVADSENLVPRDYPLAAFGAGVDPQFLVTAMMELTSGSWKEIHGDGGEIAAVSPQVLRILQSREVHAELQLLSEQFTVASGGRRIPTAQDRGEQALIKKLQTPAMLTTDETFLSTVLEQLLKKNGIPYWVDEVSISDQGVDWKLLKSEVVPKKLSPAARLDAMATEHKLAWRIVDEIVVIMSAEYSDEKLFTRVYDIRRSNRPGPVLAQQLMQNKDLGPWMDVDDEGGTIMPLGTSLVIRQNAKVHARIAKLLN